MKRIRCRNAVYQRLMSGDATLQLTEHESASLRRMAYGKATTTQASPRTNTPKKSFLMPQPFTSNELDCLNATQMPRSVAVAATKITYRCNFLASEICDANNDTQIAEQGTLEATWIGACSFFFFSLTTQILRNWGSGALHPIRHSSQRFRAK